MVKNAREQEKQSGLAIMESLCDRLGGPDVHARQTLESRFVVDLVDFFDDDEVTDGNQSCLRRIVLDAAQERLRLGDKLLRALMELRGKQPELVMIDAKSLASLVNASFAENDRLSAFDQRAADHSPFLERNATGRVHC